MLQRPRFLYIAVVVLLISATYTLSVHAQERTTPAIAPEPDTPEPALPPSPSNPLRMGTSWEDGLVIQNDDANYRLQFGTFLRVDGRYIPNDPGHVGADTFTIRAARMTVQGRIARYFTFRIMPDFVGSGGATPNLLEGWFDIELAKALHIHVGRDKTQIGYEALLPDANLLFIERGTTVNLQPLRDVGLQIYGDLPGGIVSYATGVFNGTVDGANSANLDGDTSKDVVARVVVTPFARTVLPVKNLNFAVAGSRGTQIDAGLPSFRTSAQQTYFAYDSAARSNGRRTRFSAQTFYYFKQVGAFAEYSRSTQAVSRGDVTADITNTAWQADVSYLVTGETAGERVRPSRTFSPERHQYGALQVMARYGTISADPAAFSLGFATPTSSRQANVGTLGAIWYLTSNVKLLFNVERTVFDHNPDGGRYAEHAALMRAQLNF